MPFNPISYFKNKWRRRSLRKQEMYIDQQYLDAIEVIKTTTTIYLDLLNIALQNADDDSINRLQTKLNSNFEYLHKDWNGSVKISQTISSMPATLKNGKRLKIEKK